MNKARACILIYNPISGHGHLDSWNALFISLLLERGYRVLALTPDRKALDSRLAQRKLSGHPLLHMLDWNAFNLVRRTTNHLDRLANWWPTYGDLYANHRQGSAVTPGMHFFVRLKKRVLQLVVPPLYRASKIIYSCADDQNASESHLLDPADTAERIRAGLKNSPWRPDCVFNMYLDMYRTDAKSWGKFEAICRFPWGGIRFVPSDSPQEGYYRLRSLRGICLLDETACQRYGASITNKCFQYLPDVTNAEVPEGPCTLAEEVKRRAAGRKMVFLGGSIGGQKNIARWCELIALADPTRWFFVQVGEIHANTFSWDDAAAFERLAAAPPENVFLYRHYLPDEREFNAIVRVANILFAAYRDFRISSNMLSKAAHFEKPILVSDGYLMADKVRRYGIGLVVPQDNAQAMLIALERLAAKPVQLENFAAYRAEFNEQAAGNSLEMFLEEAMVP